MIASADRLYVGETLVWDAAGGGSRPVTTVFSVVAGVGEVALDGPVFVVTQVVVDAPVRIRFYSTPEGRTMDLSRTIYTPYPGDRCLMFELNATTPGTFIVPFVGKSPLLWTADAAATITVTWRSIA